MFKHVDAAGRRVLAALALAVLLAGCGGASSNGITSKTPAEILAATKAAAESATSVRVISTASQGPLKSTSNLQLTNDGGHARISLLGLVYEAIRTGETAYLKGNRALYTHLNALTANAVGNIPTGTWLKASSNSGPIAEVAAVTDLRRELNVLLGVTGPLTIGATTTIHGQNVIELKETAKLFTGSLYIATTGKPYPIELLKHGRETSHTTFTNWNKPIPLTPPANTITIK